MQLSQADPDGNSSPKEFFFGNIIIDFIKKSYHPNRLFYSVKNLIDIMGKKIGLKIEIDPPHLKLKFSIFYSEMPHTNSNDIRGRGNPMI